MEDVETYISILERAARLPPGRSFKRRGHLVLELLDEKLLRGESPIDHYCSFHTCRENKEHYKNNMDREDIERINSSEDAVIFGVTYKGRTELESLHRELIRLKEEEVQLKKEKGKQRWYYRHQKGIWAISGAIGLIILQIIGDLFTQWHSNEQGVKTKTTVSESTVERR